MLNFMIKTIQTTNQPFLCGDWWVQYAGVSPDVSSWVPPPQFKGLPAARCWSCLSGGTRSGAKTRRKTRWWIVSVLWSGHSTTTPGTVVTIPVNHKSTAVLGILKLFSINDLPAHLNTLDEAEGSVLYLLSEILSFITSFDLQTKLYLA